MATRPAEIEPATAPHRYAHVETEIEILVYRLEAVNSGCCFRRTLDFRCKRLPWRLLDSTLTRWILERQSARALANLKRLLEGPCASLSHMRA